jgi:nitrogen fixation/metabolism regulation signal transduction histidine kinase
VSTPTPESAHAVRTQAQEARGLRWTVGVGIAAMAAIGLVLLFLLTQATNNRELYERNYALLFGLNVFVAGVLLLVILWIGVRLLVRLRKRRFGSRLLVKLAAIFALAGFAPGMLIYVVSYQFVSRSIETWFDVKVEGALDAGLNLGRVSLEALSDELTNKTRLAAPQLATVTDAAMTLPLERLRDQLGASDIGLFSASGQLITAASKSRFKLTTERPSPQQFRTARGSRSVTWIEGLDEGTGSAANDARIKVLVLMPNPGIALLAEPRFLLVTQALPVALVANALAVSQAYREYQERSLAREGLKRMYIGTLTLSLFLAVFGAVLLAVVLGNQIVRPLLLLADGVSKVAAGDLTPKVTLSGKDELGGLTRDFANMTQQLADARQAVGASMEQVDAARANLQTILDNLTAGVIVLSAEGVIRSSNPGATRILRLPMAAYEGKRLDAVPGLEDLAQQVQSRFDAFLGERSADGLDHWQQSFELGASTQGSGLTNHQRDNTIALVARGAKLPGTDRLLVFDDISEIVSAQRAQAWGEVARRLAHEIKNPLTPIQLSAERLEMKLSGKVTGPEQAILTKSVKTIVDQVDAMKRLVNEFRDYARLPAAELKPMDLNALLTDIAQLYEIDNARVPVLMELDVRCPRILGDAQQLRQVVHNLVQNAQDATVVAAGQSGERRAVTLRTVWVPTSRRVRLVVQDQGSGFPEQILKRAFEPYVTTKTKGTGLGLAVVKKIADEHGSRIDIANRVDDGTVLGAQVSLSFAVDNTKPDSSPA